MKERAPYMLYIITAPFIFVKMIIRVLTKLLGTHSITRLQISAINLYYHRLPTSGFAFTIRYNGLRLRFKLKEKLAWSGFLRWHSEETEMKLLKVLCPFEVFIDVGAFVGIYSFSLVGDSRLVIAVEPNPSALEVIKRNVLLNRLGDKLIVVPLVCHERDNMTVNFNYWKVSDNAYKAGLSGIFNKNAPYTTKVRTITLDTLVEKLKLACADIIKIDVEGAELFVLRGAMKLLTTHRPIILIEIMDNNMPDCLDMFGKVGYTVFGPLTQYKGNANYLAVPKEKVSSLENVLKRFDIYSKHSSST
ncbi:MAG: FkbM family methyltransferase [Thermoproteota archaeon]